VCRPFSAWPPADPPFEARGSPVIYAAVAVGGRLWMLSWQEWQTTRVLRRFLAMTVFHVGWSAPAGSSWASLRIWWTCTFPGSSHSSHLPLRSRTVSSLKG
jgi:hypothetical protein